MILTRNLHMFQDILEPKVGNKNSSLEKNVYIYNIVSNSSKNGSIMACKDHQKKYF